MKFTKVKEVLIPSNVIQERSNKIMKCEEDVSYSEVTAEI